MALQDPQSEKLHIASGGRQNNPTIFVLPANRRGPVPEGLGVEFERGGQAVIMELEKLGFTVEFIDVNQKPWNPLAGQPSMLKAIDPLRALKILLRRPRPDIVLSYFESGALCLALLRSIGLFRAPIIVVDIGVGINDAGRIAAEFQHDLFLTRFRLQFPANAGRAGETQ